MEAGRNYFHPGGIRLRVSEITRLGMKKKMRWKKLLLSSNK